ncbi:sulfotransferase family protein [Spirosoma luteum]|uniref:sulfotransferase family protein n=1 Tax=Spirosoma luteum TaxID=431553 RepID=UPI0012F77D0C|nr:sulfotransferase family protein [Spirosoma luteum]
MPNEWMDEPLENWIPYQLRVVDEQLLFRWLYVGTHRFTEPFFEETVIRCKSYPVNVTGWHSATTLDGLIQAAQGSVSISPNAFIFHISRCGSTLLSQLLGLPERHITLSEMPLLDEILRLPYREPAISLSPDERDAALKAVIRLIGSQRTGNETRFFIKLDSWHLLFYDTFRRLYPTVPFILLFRSPDAVIRSHQKRRGMQAVPGLIEPELFGFDPALTRHMNQDHYTAAVLERYFQQMLAIQEVDENVYPLPYQDSGVAMLGQLTTLVTIDATPAERTAMKQRSQYHSKYPDQPFQEAVPQTMPGSYMEPVRQLYQQLVSQKKGTSSVD